MDCSDSLEYYRLLLKVSGEAAAFLRDHACIEGYGKVLKDDTIKADVEAESYIIDILKSEGFRGVVISEERGRIDLGGNELALILDPLDGSTNFRYCIPWCNVSIALLKKADKGWELTAGSIAPVFFGDPVGFARGRGCFIGLSRARPASGGNLVLVYADKPNDVKYLVALIEVIRRRHKDVKVRSLGSAALELAYTALGRSVLFADLRGSLRNVDVAAALGMLRECGGVALNERGEVIDVTPERVERLGIIVASLDGELVKEVISKLKEAR